MHIMKSIIRANTFDDIDMRHGPVLNKKGYAVTETCSIDIKQKTRFLAKVGPCFQVTTTKTCFFMAIKSC